MNYLLGVDFGTLSCRAVLLDETGDLVATAARDYPHGCIDGENSAVYQEPRDYLDCISSAVRQVVKGREADVLSLCIDFTACTMLPVDAALQPLDRARLWKSHSATDQARRVTEACRELGMDLSCYGGTVSPEWLIPKILEIREDSPEIYEKTAWFLEAADWLTWLLTGQKIRSACFAGFKGLWQGGWPTDLIRRLGLEERFFEGQVRHAGACVGQLNAYGCRLLGLTEKTKVTVPLIDAHSALPAAGVYRDGDMMLILGTSGCELMLSKQSVNIPGFCGRVYDGLLPGYYCYEAGTPCLGDMFGWFTRHLLQEEKGFARMDSLAEKLTDNPVWAIDWWNGSRTPYLDADLSGCLFGLSLRTGPEHIYRALLEAAAFGTRRVLELARSHGAPVTRLVAGGGIPQKNPLFMQILADVLEKTIYINENEPASAVGAAILSAWGGGLYPSAEAAIEALAKKQTRCFVPSGAHYGEKYRRYVKMSDALAAK